jgi:hypothetical protein
MREKAQASIADAFAVLQRQPWLSARLVFPIFFFQTGAQQ